MRAERQSAGQGRLGRSWQSPAGNLHASTIVRPLVIDPPAPTLALVAGVALHDAAHAWAAEADLRLKWPNDLMVGPAKLAGILLQATNGAIVAGFGVNLVQHPTGLGRPTTSLTALVGGAPDPATFLDTLVEAFARWLGRWRGEGLASIRRAWLARAYPLGTPLRVAAEEGLFDGLTETGALRLRRPDGVVKVVTAGDIALA